MDDCVSVDFLRRCILFRQPKTLATAADDGYSENTGSPEAQRHCRRSK